MHRQVGVKIDKQQQNNKHTVSLYCTGGRVWPGWAVLYSSAKSTGIDMPQHCYYDVHTYLE